MQWRQGHISAFSASEIGDNGNAIPAMKKSMFARLLAFMEKGIWGFHFGSYDFALKSPWVDAVPDLYSVKSSRRYKMGRWQIIICKFDRHG
jgi:hypothetical protein